MRTAIRVIPAVLLIVIALMLAACKMGSVFSSDPTIAATQQWALACKATDANINTAIVLRNAGQLSESAVEAMDEVVVLYAVICTGDPPSGDGDLASGAVKLIAARVCPSLNPSNFDDWVLTIAEAANCAAEAALLAEAT